MTKEQRHQNVLILNTPNTETVRTAVVTLVGVADVEVQVAAVAAIHRSEPVVAGVPAEPTGPGSP